MKPWRRRWCRWRASAGAAGGRGGWFRRLGRRSVVLVSGDTRVRRHTTPAGRHGEGRSENLRGHALAAGDQPIAGARRQIVEQAHGGAQIAILPRRRIDHGEQLAPDRPRRDQRAYTSRCGAGTPRRSCSRPRAPAALARPPRAEVGNADSGKGPHSARDAWQSSPPPSGSAGGGQRGAPELPDFERDLAAGGAGGA